VTDRHRSVSPRYPIVYSPCVSWYRVGGRILPPGLGHSDTALEVKKGPGLTWKRRSRYGRPPLMMDCKRANALLLRSAHAARDGSFTFVLLYSTCCAHSARVRGPRGYRNCAKLRNNRRVTFSDIGVWSGPAMRYCNT
jgi:hypothetical protein